MKFIDLYDEFNCVVIINISDIAYVCVRCKNDLPKKYIKNGYIYMILITHKNLGTGVLIYKDFQFYQENMNRLAEAMNLDFEIEDEHSDVICKCRVCGCINNIEENLCTECYNKEYL